MLALYGAQFISTIPYPIGLTIALEEYTYLLW
jgi:hypothetical protein